MRISDCGGFWALFCTKNARLNRIRDRHGRGSTLIASQLPTEHRHDYIGSATLADAILGRLLHGAHRLNLSGESLRKVALAAAGPVDGS